MMVQDLSNLFLDREDAAIKLLDMLPVRELQEEKWILLGLSLRTVPILEFLSKKTGLSYDFLFTEPIYSPNNPECVIAMVSENEEIVMQEALVNSFDIKLEYIYGEAHRKYEELILKKIYKFRKGVETLFYKGRNILLIDEGCETGLKVLVVLKTVINEGAKSVSLATPVIAGDTAELLDNYLDEIFCVNKIDGFIKTEFYYENMQNLSAEDIIAILESSKNYLPFQKSQGEEKNHGI